MCNESRVVHKVCREALQLETRRPIAAAEAGIDNVTPVERTIFYRERVCWLNAGRCDGAKAYARVPM